MTDKMILADRGIVDAFAIIVDINDFTVMVTKDMCNMRAQFIRDILGGGIAAIEKAGGEVVAFMGDPSSVCSQMRRAFFLHVAELPKTSTRSASTSAMQRPNANLLLRWRQLGPALKLRWNSGKLISRRFQAGPSVRSGSLSVKPLTMRAASVLRVKGIGV